MDASLSKAPQSVGDRVQTPHPLPVQKSKLTLLIVSSIPLSVATIVSPTSSAVSATFPAVF